MEMTIIRYVGFRVDGFRAYGFGFRVDKSSSKETTQTYVGFRA